MEDEIVLIIGSGAREHAISRAYEMSRDIKKIIVAPGNDFIKYDREKEVVVEKDCFLDEATSILRVALKYKPDLVDIAQDNAIASGAGDLLRNNGFPP